jgi:CDP-diacylglycerol--glycerol-3-phosphate 3-phosphatidyltransferase
MLNRYARALFGKILAPVARLLLRLGISPDAVTLVGTLGVCFGALAFYPRGELLWGTLIITAFVFSDMIDGLMARMLQSSSPSVQRSSAWGAFLDSTLDRFGDAAVFSGLVLFYAFESGGTNHAIAVMALACLVLGSVVSYARARAEGLGMTAAVGIAERSERLVAVLVTTGFVGLKDVTGFGFPEEVLLVVLIVLALASLYTVAQRVLVVRRQAFAKLAAEQAADGPVPNG